jgi:chromosome segregation ATPase
MKALLIVLSLVCVGLGYGFVQRNRNASREAAAAEARFNAFSNQVSELSTKLTMNQAEAAHTQSNLQHLATLRLGELASTSNRLVQLNLLYRAAQSETRAAQSEVQAFAAKLAVLEAERDVLRRNAGSTAVLEKKLAEAREKLAALTSERNSCQQEIGRLEVERVDLLRKLDDAAFLRLQLARVEEDAAVQRRMARAGSAGTVDPKARLELLADGTVRPVRATGGADPR